LIFNSHFQISSLLFTEKLAHTLTAIGIGRIIIFICSPYYYITMNISVCYCPYKGYSGYSCYFGWCFIDASNPAWQSLVRMAVVTDYTYGWKVPSRGESGGEYLVS